MSHPEAARGWRRAVLDTLGEAAGHGRRVDPRRARTGGPAGNARLTAWTGLMLLVLSVAELATLLNLGQLVSWHIAIGAMLLPPALLKTGSTGWRIVRYYDGNHDYRRAGPPPMPLRVLGPFVIVSTLGLLASGVILIALGVEGSRHVLLNAVGQRVDWVTVHQALFIVWAVVTGLHVLARLLPAIGLSTRRLPPDAGVDGGLARGAALLMTAVLAAICAALLLSAGSGWRHSDGEFHRHDEHRQSAGATLVQ